MTGPKKPGIYAIVAPSGRAYIGSAVNIAARWAHHRNALLRGDHHNVALQHAFRKYGEYLTYTVLELCDKSDLLVCEQKHIDTYDFARLYNHARFAEAPGRGRVHKPETKEKMRIAAIGRKHTEAARAKMRIGHLGKIVSAETRAKRGAALKGKDRHDIALPPSGYRGVYMNRAGNWTATSDTKAPRRHIGSFRSPELAYAMRLLWAAALEHRT